MLATEKFTTAVFHMERVSLTQMDDLIFMSSQDL